MRIVIAAFLCGGHIHNCVLHPYGCGNSLLENAGNGVGRLVHLHLVEETNLACHVVREGGTVGCRICFTAREYAVGDNARQLGGLLLKITQVSLPDSENSSMRA